MGEVHLHKIKAHKLSREIIYSGLVLSPKKREIFQFFQILCSKTFQICKFFPNVPPAPPFLYNLSCSNFVFNRACVLGSQIKT
uniref:Ovule protein n=1 Tax=Romanomermis culicivorax TaxID=13658 RepID=A0A915I1W5_ROMCU